MNRIAVESLSSSGYQEAFCLFKVTLMCSNRLANVSSNLGRFGEVIDLSWLLRPGSEWAGGVRGGQREGRGARAPNDGRCQS